MNRLSEALRRNAEGYTSAHAAAKIALEQGKLLIGTAVSLEQHTSTILLDSDSGKWEPILQNDRGVLPAFRATNSVDIAVWCGFGGNSNIPLQRMITPGVRPIIPDSSPFGLGTFGWEAPHGHIAFRLHQDSPSFTERLPDSEIVGAIDIIDTPDYAYEQQDEPGNFFVYGSALTIGTIAVRMGDVRRIPFSTQFFEERYNQS